MQSKTSFFNKAIFFNTIRRFWPVWLVYLGVWAINMPMSLVDSFHYAGSDIDVKRSILSTGSAVGIILGFICAVLIAMMVWSFVYNSRSMSGIACLPVSRGRVFASVVMAGFVPVLVINLFICLITAGLCAMAGYSMLLPCMQVFCMASMEFIFFYGFATLCAQLTGNIIVLPAVYLVLNFTAYVVESISGWIADVLIYGFWGRGEGVSAYLSPLMAFLSRCGVNSIREYVPQYDEWIVVDARLDGWGFVAIYAVVGIALMAAALALYRRRRMETVGDIVAINVLKPIFKYCLTFGCAMVFAYVVHSMTLAYYSIHATHMSVCILVLMLFGGLLGYFAAEMLIEKSFRVFRGHWKGMGISALIIILVTGCIELDLFGIERRIPDVEDVESVYVVSAANSEFREAENIEKAIEIHSSIVANKKVFEDREVYLNGNTASTYVQFEYILKNGRSLSREYYITYSPDDVSTQTELQELQKLQNSAEGIAYRNRLSFELTDDTIQGGEVSCWLTAEQLEQIGVKVDIETYILEAYYGYDSTYVEKYMTAEEKAQLISDYFELNDPDDVGMNGYYSFKFSADEMYELYTECILPDMADAKLGYVWTMADETYEQSVYAAEISITMHYKSSNTASTAYAIKELANPQVEKAEFVTYTFRVIPTVDAVRTLKWLEEHGVIMNTVEEQKQLGEDYSAADIPVMKQ